MDEQNKDTAAHAGAAARKALFAARRESSRVKFQQRVFLIPCLVTVVAFFAGFLGAVLAVRGDFETAVKCIAVAILFDGLDGRVARKLNATSAFGREFDSLSDLVAFGVAPALLCYNWALKPLAEDFGILVVFVYLVCGAARLARFNIASEASPEPKKHFDGLPIPGAAAAFGSVVYFHPEALTTPYAAGAVVGCMLILAFLMVSMVPFLSLKHLKLTHENTRQMVIALSFVVALIWYHSRFAILLLSCGYAISGPLLAVMRMMMPGAKQQPPVKTAKA